MANEQNLRSFGDIPKEQHLEYSAAGGRASGVTKRKARNMREAARILLEAKLLDDPETEAALQTLGLEADQQGAVLLAALRKSQAGDIEAARFVRDTSGQAPAQQVALGGIDGKPIESLNLSELSTEQLNELLKRHDNSD